MGAVPGPGGAQPQRGLEAAGHLCLQHGASPLGGGGGEAGTRVRADRETVMVDTPGNTCTPPHLRAEEETVFAARCPPEDASGSVNIHPLISIYKHGFRIAACWY